MQENAPTNKPEEEVDMSYVDMAEGRQPSVMDNLRAAQEGGDPAVLAQAQAAADKQYEVGTPDALEVEEKPIETQSEDELKSLLLKMNEEEKSFYARGVRPDEAFLNKRFAVMDRIEDLRLDKLETEMTTAVQPSSNLDKAIKFSSMRRGGMGAEGLYSSREEYVADVLAVLNSGMTKEEKLKMLDGIGYQVESQVVGNDYSDVVRRMKKRLQSSS
jgi:hypothetical protein